MLLKAAKGPKSHANSAKFQAVEVKRVAYTCR